MMKLARIKQLFLEFARALPEPGMPENTERGGPQILRGPLLIRDGLVMRDELALAYVETLEEMYESAPKDGSWSKSAVDDLLAKHLLAVAKAGPSERQDVIKAEADQFEAELKTKLTTWEMDLSVFGMANDCTGLSFGKLRFMTDVVNSQVRIPGIVDPGVNTLVLFARTRVEAIDRKSAMDRARDIVDQHLAVLNALCSDLVPSRTHLAHTNAASRKFALYRTLPVEGPTSVAPEERELRSALESVVLGRDTQTEITYQLSTRIAHLLSDDLASRKIIVKRVSGLYGLRSKIVHAGSTDIPPAEVESIRDVCLSTLFALATLAPFANMTRIEELEEWFKDRMLGASDLPGIEVNSQTP